MYLYLPSLATVAYCIAGFSCEDFNLAIGLIRNIKIRKVFNYVVFNSCACTKLANCSVIYWSTISLLQLRIHLVWHSHIFMHDVIDRYNGRVYTAIIYRLKAKNYDFHA